MSKSTTLDFTSWTSEQWRLFIITSISFLIDGLIFSISPLIIYSINTLVKYATYILGINMIFWTLGSILLGRLGDIIGRKLTFLIVLILEFLSIGLLYIFYTNVILFTFLTSLACFSIGGEFGAAFSAIAELTPPDHRGKAILLASNFWNLGAVIISSLSLLYKYFINPILQIKYLLASTLVIVVLTGFARIGFPESIRWLVIKGRIDDVKRILLKYNIKLDDNVLNEYKVKHNVSIGKIFSKYSYRIAILLILTIAVYVTYFIPTFYLPYTPDFPFSYNTIPLIILISNLGSFIGAFLLIPIIDRGRRISTFISLLGGFITALIMIFSIVFKNIYIFLITLFWNMVFSQWSWSCISALQSELFPTGVRSTIIGFFVSFEGILTAILTFLEAFLTASICMTIIALLWLAGLIASLSWLIRGVESARISVDLLV